MISKLRIILVAVAVVFGVSGTSFAMSDCDMGAHGNSDQASAQSSGKGSEAVDAGNKRCPVLGGEVSGKDFYEYKGKRYGLCCAMCSETFDGDPEKYSAIADKDAAGEK